VSIRIQRKGLKKNKTKNLAPLSLRVRYTAILVGGKATSFGAYSNKDTATAAGVSYFGSGHSNAVGANIVKPPQIF
jgi:hypothetical protein